MIRGLLLFLALSIGASAEKNVRTMIESRAAPPASWVCGERVNPIHKVVRNQERSAELNLASDEPCC